MEEEKYLKTDRFACTTMIVGKDASIDGSVIIAHSDDDVSDTRVICVPSQPGGENITRPVYYDDACRRYPRASTVALLKDQASLALNPGFAAT